MVKLLLCCVAFLLTACGSARVVSPLDGAWIDSVTACVPVPVTAKVERCQ